MFFHLTATHPPHVLHRTYITAGHVTAWYSLLLVAVDIFLDCSTLIELKEHLLLNKIQCHIVLLMLLILFTVDPNSLTVANVGLLISNVRFCVINSIILVFPQFAERRPNFFLKFSSSFIKSLFHVLYLDLV